MARPRRAPAGAATVGVPHILARGDQDPLTASVAAAHPDRRGPVSGLLRGVVEDEQLHRLARKPPRIGKCRAHRDLVREIDRRLVGLKPYRRHAARRFGAGEHRIEPPPPRGSERIDRKRGERLDSAGDHQMELGAPRQQCLGDEDVGSRRERPVAEADALFGKHRGDLAGQRRRLHVGAERHVPAEMQRARRAERIEPAVVPALRGQDQRELVQRRGVILPGARREPDRLGQRRLRFLDPAEQQQCLGAGGGPIIRRLGLVGVPLDPCQDSFGERPGLSFLAGEQRKRRGVDQRIGGVAKPRRLGIGGSGPRAEAAAVRRRAPASRDP